MTEKRPKVELVEAPTIEIGDINDITGVIYDKERHITSGKVDVTVIGDNVGLAKESTLSSIDSKITKCNTDSVIISTGFTGVRLTATDIMLPVDMQARYYASSKEIDQLVNPGSIVTGANIIYTANFNSVTVMGRCEFDGILHVDCSPLGYNFFKDVYVVNISSGQVFTASFSERFEHVVIRVENTTTTTGQAIVYVNRGV